MNTDTRHPVDKRRTMGGLTILSGKGFCMGIADLIPGISGGTIALLLGIYEDLIKALKSFDSNFFRLFLTGRFRRAFASVAWRFLAAIAAGVITAVILLSRLITWLLAHHPVLLHAFFFGLILVTVPIIARSIRLWNALTISLLIAASCAAFFLVQVVPVMTPESWWFIFLSGALAICAMILPGISGAFILLILGKYQFMLEAIHQRDVGVIAVFVCGMAVGVFSFVRVVEWFLRRFHDLTIAVLTGFVIGSLNKIWPWKQALETMTTAQGKVITLRETNVWPPEMDGYFILAVFLFLAGSFAAFALHSFPQKSFQTKL